MLKRHLERGVPLERLRKKSNDELAEELRPYCKERLRRINIHELRTYAILTHATAKAEKETLLDELVPIAVAIMTQLAIQELIRVTQKERKHVRRR